MTKNNKPHVVIIGAGFGGIEAAKILGSSDAVRVTIIDRSNHHLFQPLLYQVATGGLSPADIAMPVRAVLRHYSNVTSLMAEVTTIDRSSNDLTLANGTRIQWDYLILATGARHGYFGNDQWEQHAPGLKTIDDATEIRRKILTAFELAEQEPDRVLQKELLTFVVVGGGPTGVELAGAIAELARFAMAKDFRNANLQDTRVVLVEGSDHLLKEFDPQLSKHAEKSLIKLGVELRLNTFVTGIGPTEVLTNKQPIRTRTAIWAAGVVPSTLGASVSSQLDPSGKVIVRPGLQIEEDDKVYVVGDLAAAPWGDTFVPAMSPGAMQGGRHAARNILRQVRGEEPVAFKYIDKGCMATIGRARAVAQLKSLRFGGFVAWLLWLFVHIFYLVGFRNRLVVFVQWAWSWFTYRRGARLITDSKSVPDNHSALRQSD